MKVLVTGANGFVGKYLVQALQERNHEVIAGLQNPVDELAGQSECVCFDILHKEQVNQVIASLQPDGIIHLAAQSMVKIAWESPADTLTVNAVGTINIVNAVAKYSGKSKIITVGSSEEYGRAGEAGHALLEETVCLPQNPYAVSKLAAGQIALQLAERDKINVMHVRPFNHFGPRQRRGFVVSDFASQLAGIEKGLADPVIYVGDLSAQRDFTDVRDVVQAYFLLLEKDVATGIYNVCSGKARSAREILELLMAKCTVKIEVKIDQEKYRPSSVPLFIGCSNKIFQATGWVPQRNFNDSISETLNWWREQDLLTE